MAEEKEEKKKGGLLKWIILLLLVLILAGGGFFAYMTFFADKPAAEEEVQTQQLEQEERSPEDAQVVTLPTFLVNLSDPLGRRYLKLQLDVEVVDGEAAAMLEKQAAKVRDAIILLLSSKTYADLAPLENKILLKNELVTRLNQIMGGSKVIRVYFTDLVIQ